MQWLRLATLVLVSASPACTLGMKYAQCQSDSDCPTNNDAKQFCTSDQICVPDTPRDRLCALTVPEQPAPTALHLGALLPLPPESTSPTVLTQLHAMQLAVSEINELAKTDQAKPLVLHVCDISGSAGDARNSLDVLINTYGVAAVVGPDSAQALSDVVGLASSSAVPILSPAGTASSLVQLPSLGFLFRLAPVETQQASTLAREVPNGGLLGLVSSEDTYGNNVRRSFLTAWMSRDQRNNQVRFPYSYSESMSAQLDMAAAQLVVNEPTYVLTVATTTQPRLIEKLRDLPNPVGDPMRVSQIVASDTARSDELLELARRADMIEHLKRVRGIGPLSITAGVEGTEFKTAFTARFPDDRLVTGVYAAYSYDAVFLAAVAMNSIKGEVKGAAVQSVLRMMTNSMNVLPLSRVTFADTVRAVQQGNTFTLSGATGAIRFTPEGSRDPALFERWTIDTTNPARPTYVSTPL